MTILIKMPLHTGCIAGIFITGSFTANWWEFLTSRTGIPGGPELRGIWNEIGGVHTLESWKQSL